MTISIGTEAPDFRLHATTGAEIRLSDYRGKQHVVLLFFPLAFSSTCLTELCSVRDTYQRYRDLDAEVLGISVDSVYTLKAWAAQENFPFPLLSDFNLEVAPRYDSLYDRMGWMKNVPKRSAFVIDKEGVLRYAELCDAPSDLPDFGAIQGVLAGHD